MDQVIEILKLVLPFFLGGGLSWIFFFRIKRTELENRVFVHEYKDIEEILDSFTKRNTRMAHEIGNLQNSILKKELVIGQLQNRIRNECACNIKEELETILGQI